MSLAMIKYLTANILCPTLCKSGVRLPAVFNYNITSYHPQTNEIRSDFHPFDPLVEGNLVSFELGPASIMRF